MDQEGSEQKADRVKEDERQYAGLDRHFKLPDGFGWFSEDPRLITPEMLQAGRFTVKHIQDLSDKITFVEGEEYRLASGSFDLEMDLGKYTGGMIFTFSHPEDIREFLSKAEVEHPQEMIGREMNLYWFGYSAEDSRPHAARVVGVDLLGYIVPLSELIKKNK